MIWSVQYRTCMFTVLNRDRYLPRGSGNSGERIKKHFLDKNTISGKTKHNFDTSGRNHSSPWPQIRLHYASGTVWVNCSHFLLRSCRDSGRINSMTESETNARQNTYGSCAVDCTDTAYFHHLFHLQEGWWVRFHLIKALPIVLYSRRTIPLTFWRRIFFSNFSTPGI